MPYVRGVGYVSKGRDGPRKNSIAWNHFAEGNHYTPEQTEFLQEIIKAKDNGNHPVVSEAEAFRIAIRLGWRRVVERTALPVYRKPSVGATSPATA